MGAIRTSAAADVASPPPLPSLSARSSDEAVAALAARLVPSWSAASLSPSSIEVKVISGGITNALWSATIKGEEKREKRSDGVDEGAKTSAAAASAILPRAVAVRAYGDGTELLIDREREVETLRRLNSSGFGARVVASFSTGRVEELLPGRAMTPEEASERGTAERIARGLARLHSVGVVSEGRGRGKGTRRRKSCSCPSPWSSMLRPWRRRQRDCYGEGDSELFSTIYEWISLAEDLDYKAKEGGGGADDEEEKKREATTVDGERLRAEVAILERRIRAACSPPAPSPSPPAPSSPSPLDSSSPSPPGRSAPSPPDRSSPSHRAPSPPHCRCPELSRVVFCHMDLLPGNIMTTGTTSLDDGSESAERGPRGDAGSGPGPGLQFIDFEYGRPCAAAFDVGNHWCEYAGLECDWSRYPSREQRESFARAYLSEAASLRRRGEASPEGAPEARLPEPSSVSSFVELGELFSLAAHLFWTSWAKVQAHVSPIDFDYGEYASSRFEEYLCRKGSVALMRE